MKEEYMTRVDFLPNDGTICVDLSGLTYVCSDGDGGGDARVVQARRMNDFSFALRKRGNYFTTESVLDDAKALRNYHKCLKGRLPREGKQDGNSCILKAYNRVISVLEEGRELYPPRSMQFSVESVSTYIDGLGENYGINLSRRARDFLVGVVPMGGGHGILSANMRLIEGFKKAIHKFGMSDCFVSNSMRAFTSFPGRR